MFLKTFILLFTLLGVPDTTSRFHGLSFLSLAQGPTITSVTRIEDLSDPNYVNRFHLVFQVTQSLPSLIPQYYNVTVAACTGCMKTVIPGWASIVTYPIDISVQNAMTAANGGWETRWQHVTLNFISPGVYELLIEEPK